MNKRFRTESGLIASSAGVRSKSSFIDKSIDSLLTTDNVECRRQLNMIALFNRLKFSVRI